jgi:hypothetical protein
MKQDVASVASESAEPIYYAGDEIEAHGELHTVAYWARCSGQSVRILLKHLRSLPRLAPEIVIAVPRCTRIDPHALPGEPHAWTWDVLPWEDDEWAQDFVARHPGGATLAEVGDALGLVRERVRQVEETAMIKLRRAALRLDVPVKSMLEALSALR